MRRNLLSGALCALLLFLLPFKNLAQSPPNLRSTASFALFTATGAFSNVGASTIVTGDVGTNVGAFSAFPPGVLVGQRHVADPASAQAATDVSLAYGEMSTITCGSVISTTLGGGQTLLPNVYCLGAASTVNGDLILDGQGNPNSLFIFKIDGALATTVNSRIILTNSASICNVYWQVNGEVDLGNNSLFQGTLLVNGAINLLEAAQLNGRALSTAGAISLHNNIVNVSAQPTASVITAGGPTTFCAGGSVVLSGNNGGTWSTGATTPTITVTQAGDYSVTNTNACGTVTSNHIIVTVNPLPVCTIAGNSAICPGTSTQLCAPAGAASYSWNTGATTNCITVNTPATYIVAVTGANGCVSTCSKTVTTSTTPVCTITGSDTICQGQSTQLCVPAGATSYLWSTGATTNCITVSTPGTYTVTVNNAGGCVSTCSKTVTAGTLPVCTIEGNSAICPGSSTQLCAPAGAASYLWSTGATTNCITVNAAGTYTVTVTSATGCTSTCSKTITVSQTPGCLITGSGTICEGGSTQLCVPAGATSYLWSTGATTNCITVSTPGTYTVTVTDVGGCVSTCSKTVTTSTTPVCTIEGNSAICPGGSTQLCVPAGATSYLWSTGATTNCITVSTPGTYTVTVTNAGGCVSTCSKTVTTSTTPVCMITGSGTICQGGSTQLCVPAGATSYSWNTGATTNCITVNSPATYIVAVTDAGGCVSTCSKTVTTSTTPVCTITGSDTICQGQSTQLCVPAGATSYLWSTGATTNCITVSTPGTYTVTVTNAGGCVSTCSKTVTTSTTPVCTITGSDTICQGQSTQLCVPAGATSYLWNTGATTNCITVSTPGTYTVTVTNAGGCVSTCSKTVTTSTTPVCTITGSGTICEGQSTQLCVPAGATSYLWSTGATTNCITVSTPGTYTVTVTNAGGCVSTCSKTVTVSAPIVCSIYGDTSICQGQTTKLCAPAGCIKYLWNTGATTSCINVSTPGTYTVTTTNAAGCTSTCSKTVTVGAPIACSITGDTSICQGQTTELCVSAGCEKYLWSTGATTNCIDVSTPGTYTVTTTNSAGCTSTCSKTVTVGTPIACSITGDTLICQGQTTELCVSAGCTKYLWNTGATTSCIDVSTPGTYTVTTTNSAGCTSTCSKTVTVLDVSDCIITGPVSCDPGKSIQLCAPSGCIKYLWNTGATTRCIDVSTPGTYTVTTTNSAGCTSTCSKTVTVSAPTECSITGNTSICQGQTTELCAPEGFAKYLWSTGETTSCITVSTAGMYTVTTTNSAGCSSTCSKTVTVLGGSDCIITGSVSCGPGKSIQLCAPSGYTKYLWNTGATTSCIKVTHGGTYTVTVTNAAGCETTASRYITSHYITTRKATPDTTNQTAKLETWISEAPLSVNSDNMTAKAYPNPFNGKAVVEFRTPGANEHVVVELYDMKGFKILTLFDKKVKGNVWYKTEVNGTSLSEGVYIYRISNGHQVINGKLILIK
ncbi:ice-binding family protein [Chitinophaga sp. HK235]|uniref:ice-binding family protein n=1 Tax=Chitinophaga sp. HK235 TaxID=2952571 RepID=UPI001BA522B5|nr:ice-binding family protein [Chitinophaga sp. HK235]